ncbi:MAG: DUF4890 domain-containing protein [Prevotella sp.]|nr:DUF4890 domain-containing protein [Prevotella sp.]
MMMTMIAAVLMSSAAFAQEEKKCECKCKQPDKTEMVKHRTDRVVKKYGLNDQQAASLLELNTKYADKFGGPRGHHGKKHGMRHGKKHEGQADATTGATTPQPRGDKKRPELTEEQKAQFEARRQEMEANRKAYETELKKILTEDQFKQYEADMKKHKRHGHRHDKK